MKDNEFIKALECSLSDNPPCYRCKYDGDTTTVDECMGKLMKDALDLINRKNAENERLNGENKAFGEIIKKQDDEISVLRKDLLKREDLEKSFSKTVKQFDKKLAKTVKLERAEAVKEFAERLKEYVESYDVTTGYRVTIVQAVEEETIDNLVKEMVGEIDV